MHIRLATEDDGDALFRLVYARTPGWIQDVQGFWMVADTDGDVVAAVLIHPQNDREWLVYDWETEMVNGRPTMRGSRGAYMLGEWLAEKAKVEKKRVYGVVKTDNPTRLTTLQKLGWTTSAHIMEAPGGIPTTA